MQPFLLLVASLVAVVTQSALANLLTWGGVRVELMPGLVAYAAMSTRWPLALWLALVGGVFQDALSANRLGVSAMALAVVAVLFWPARRLVFRDQWLTQFIVGGVASLLFSLIVWSMLAASGLGWGVSWTGVARIFQVALLSLLVAPFFFRAMDRVRSWVGELRDDWE